MGTILNDGTCIPSFMSVTDMGVVDTSSGRTNFALREGEVKEIVYPQDTKSQSKMFIEYVVAVRHSEGGTGVVATSRYRGVLASSLFGGVADFLKYTLRSDDGGGDTAQDGIGVGSKVLVLCSGGVTSSAIIIGGMRDKKNDPTAIDKKSDGHNLSFAFNGISAKINDSGEFKLQFMGKTDVKGGLAKGVDADASPTTLEITKDGSLEIYTKDRNQYLKFDHANKKVTFQADSEWDVQVNGKSQMNVGGPVDWSFGNTCSIAIKQNTSVNIFAGKLDITAPLGQVNIKSMGVNVGLATNAWPLFTVYRLAEVTMHTAVMASLTTAAASLAAAGSVMTIPVAGAIAAAVPINAASAAITAAVTAMMAFEAMAPTYLSLKNRSD